MTPLVLQNTASYRFPLQLDGKALEVQVPRTHNEWKALDAAQCRIPNCSVIVRFSEGKWERRTWSKGR
jgi:hypothetical protein